ncbi:hypothetical protein [Sulfuriferula sp.]|nr:hypothetical protein [Sulfuriferula sp.]MDP1620557.1 hypothetical protein [bacterium]MDP2026418.1 hypothetical protein [Sulfuriferula sp.]
MTTLQISARAVRALRKARHAESSTIWQLCMIVVFVIAAYAVVYG